VVINKEMQTTEVVLTMPDTANFVPGFEKFFVSVTGDMLGSTMKNLVGSCSGWKSQESDVNWLSKRIDFYSQ